MATMTVPSAKCGHCGERLPLAEVKAHYAAKYAEATAPAPPALPAVPLVDPGFTPADPDPEPKSTVDWKAVRALPAGRYALPGSGKDSIEFYRVEAGKKDGYRFISRLLGAPGKFKKLFVAKSAQVALLSTIAADPAEAAKRFVDHFVACSRCCSPLSDDTSRARGFGPDCYDILIGQGVTWIA